MALGLAESGAVAIVLLGNISAWAKMIYDTKKNGKNGNGVGYRIAAIEAQQVGLTSELGTLHSENRADHLQIFAEVKSLSISVACAAAAAAQAAATAATLATARKKGRNESIP